ncbi:MAG: GreA/GreB family elongation factor [Nitrospinota bacterium]|nr:GreA/GreB family elongation factor [Nitrospinota bacterium]
MRLPVLEKLEKELKESERELKVDIPEALKVATAMGDLSENADYKAAKERQMFLESRVSLLQKRVADITALNINRIPKDQSALGSTLTLKEIESGEPKTYQLVFPEEVDPDSGKISPGSPVGKALLGKREGDQITISMSEQTRVYEVMRLITIHEDQRQDSD